MTGRPAPNMNGIPWFDDSWEEDVREAELLAGIVHKDGIPWYDAPIPHRWHRCKVQTLASEYNLARCACGALKFITGPGAGLWGERNTRKRKR